MSFFRAIINTATGLVEHVLEQSTPFESGGTVRAAHASFEAVDLGFVLLHDWRDLDGRPATPAHHVYARVGELPLARARAEIADRVDMPRFHDCPCTIDGIKARLRAQGPAGLPLVARAWLANSLPHDQVAAMGIGRGLPLSIAKAVESIRAKRDPGAGSRMAVLERKAQELSDSKTAASLAASQKGSP